MAAGCDRIAGPQAMVASALEEASRPGARFEVEVCGALAIDRAQFSRLLVKPEGRGMVAVATVDIEASFVDGPRVSYLGLERTPFRFAGARWRLDGPLLPALNEALSLMCRRRQALDAGDLAALRALGFDVRGDGLPPGGGVGRVRRWVLRIDRAQAEILEEGERGNGRFLLKRENGPFRPAPTVF